MREILFRGKRVDNGEWVYGQIVYDKNKIPFIVEEVEEENQDEVTDLYALMWYEVMPETVSQYTGLTDKNGKKIFEGDIVKCKLIDLIKKNGKWVEKITYENYEVIYSNEDLGFRFKDEWKTIWKFENCEIEVIGNIFDKEVEE